jgi:hypothetical protein
VYIPFKQGISSQINNCNLFNVHSVSSTGKVKTKLTPCLIRHIMKAYGKWKYAHPFSLSQN